MLYVIRQVVDVIIAFFSYYDYHIIIITIINVRYDVYRYICVCVVLLTLTVLDWIFNRVGQVGYGSLTSLICVEVHVIGRRIIYMSSNQPTCSHAYLHTHLPIYTYLPDNKHKKNHR